METTETYACREQAKQAVYYFCNCVKYEMTARESNDIRSVLRIMADALWHYSVGHSKDHGVRTVRNDSEIFEPFIYDRYHIPYPVAYWLNAYYGRSVSFEDCLKDKPLDVYYMIRKYFDDHHRFCKRSDKETIQIMEESRRALCKLVRDGRYNYTIAAHNSKKMSDLFTAEEFEKAHTMLLNVFCKDLEEYNDNIETAAAAFLLGVRQGLHTAGEVLKQQVNAN